MNKSVLPSCSRPLSVNFGPLSANFGPENNEDFCPSPPSLSVADQASSSPIIINSTNSYIAEHLLSEAARLDEAVFFRRYLAGITITTSADPVFSVCNCQPSPSSASPRACIFLQEELQACENPINGSCPVYSGSRAQCDTVSAPDLCDDGDDGICYTVDSVSADTLRVRLST